MLKKIMILLLILLILVQTSAATGIGISPGRLNFSAQIGISDTQPLFVKNTGEERANYLVYVDDDYSEWVMISNDNFTLEAGEVKEIFLELKPPLYGTGEHRFKAYVLSKNSNEEFGIGSGIKIPVTAIISDLLVKGIALCTILIIGIGVFVLYDKKRDHAN
ncbi:hypothetical protein HNV12_12340 [Methanococcoides sp. SA1]|nr:hypothetical protein [Methanococcoides sp. SA1]